MKPEIGVLETTKVAFAFFLGGALMLFGQQQNRFGDITFQTPARWQSGEQNGILVIRPPATRPEVAIFVLPSQPLEGDLRAAFDEWSQRLVPRETVSAAGQVAEDISGETRRIGQMLMVGKGEPRYLLVLDYGGRAGGFLFAGSSQDAMRRYQSDIDGFIASVKLSPERARSGSKWPSRSTSPSQTSTASQSWQRSSAAPTGRVSLPPLAPRPGHARGRVVDAAGRPLNNVTISISEVFWEAGFTRGTNSSTGTFQARDGSYDVELPAGTFRVTAFARIPYEGQTHTVQLQPLDGQDARLTLPSGPGIVRDFILLLQGPRGDELPSVEGSTSSRGELSIQELIGTGAAVYADVTLTPIAPMLDGSAGRVIRQSGRVVFDVKDIPIGKYRVDVSVGGRPVDFEIRDSDGSSYGRGPIVFAPNDVGIAGVKRMRLMIQ